MLTGSLLGSWTIARAGSSPTGIILDPTGGGALWVVDNVTRRVYQCDNARGVTTGSLSPSTSFALPVGNTNLQGIADPPSGAPIPVEAREDHRRRRAGPDRHHPGNSGAGHVVGDGR